MQLVHSDSRAQEFPAWGEWQDDLNFRGQNHTLSKLKDSTPGLTQVFDSEIQTTTMFHFHNVNMCRAFPTWLKQLSLIAWL